MPTRTRRAKPAASGPVPDFNDLLLTFQANMRPEAVEMLARKLGVTTDAIRRLGVGYYPAESCWVFPERDGSGKVIGLLRRYSNGKKYTWAGGKRGLYFSAVEPTTALADEAKFIRVGDAGVPCPICGKPDWCLVSNENPEDPACAICPRTPDGAERYIEGSGYLHRRKYSFAPTVSGGETTGYASTNDGRAASSASFSAETVLPPGNPVVITEGASDCLVAMALGYVAVGKSNAAGDKNLCGLVQGRDVILVGDRDPHGAGQQGMEATFQVLKPVCRSVVKILPPEGRGKDLRSWAPTRAEFEEWVVKTGDSESDGSVLSCADPPDLIDLWLRETQTNGAGQCLLVRVNGDYYRWQGTCYEPVNRDQLRGWLYGHFGDRTVSTPTSGGGVKVQKLRLNRHVIDDLDDVLRSKVYTHVPAGVSEPFLKKSGTSVSLARHVVFKNGMLNVDSDRLAPLTPDVFITSTLPYSYNPGHKCELFLTTINLIFDGDDQRIALLQEWFGYNLIASNHMQSMMFFFGRPGSGKSTLANVLAAMLGPGRCCAMKAEDFAGDKHGTTKLIGKYGVVMSESRTTTRTDCDRLLQMWKAVTGDDLISVRPMYHAPIDARLFCRLTYVANEAIVFNDPDRALAERLNLLYFDRQFRKDPKILDRDLGHKLLAELPGICNWSLDGLRRLSKQKHFTLPASSEEHLNGIVNLSDPVGNMLAECCETGPTYEVSTILLFDLWQTWSKRNAHYSSMSSTAFGMALHRRNPLVKKMDKKIGDERCYIYRGVRIRSGVLQRYCMQ